jgi:hypothetical protein
MIHPKIKDKNFAHIKNAGYYDNKVVSKYIDWYRGDEYRDVCFFTDICLTEVDSTPAKVKVAWLLEPPAIIGGSYQYILQNHHKFDYILSFAKELDKYIPKEKLLFYPMGGCWIEPEIRQIYSKTAKLSMIASNKTWTVGHRLRHEIAARYPGQIDLFGRGYKEVLSKSEALKNHMYSICVMNSQIDDYFTDVVIDAFACGTIPIFWGTNNLKNYFNEKGFYSFNTLEELDIILDNIGEVDYYSKMEYINDNFARVSKFNTPEDYLFENYQFLFK